MLFLSVVYALIMGNEPANVKSEETEPLLTEVQQQPKTEKLHIRSIPILNGDCEIIAIQHTCEFLKITWIQRL